MVVVGIDEVGRGRGPGPVTVGAVMPAPAHLRGVRDSKMLTRPSSASVRRGLGARLGRGDRDRPREPRRVRRSSG